MKKTSKKLLSFFLAVVMIVTSCSVGFTAFAAEGNKSMWNSSDIDAENAFETLDQLANLLPPVLMGIEKIGDLVYEKKAKDLGKTAADLKEDEKKAIASNATFDDILGVLQPVIIKALKGSSKDEFLKWYADEFPQYADAALDTDGFNYLDNNGQTIDYYTIIKICRDYKDLDNTNTLEKWYNTLLPLASLYPEIFNSYQADNKKIVAVAEQINGSVIVPPNSTASADELTYEDATLYELKNFKFDLTGVESIVKSRIDTFNKQAAAKGSKIKVNNFAEYVYYSMGAGNNLVSSNINEYYKAIKASGSKVTFNGTINAYNSVDTTYDITTDITPDNYSTVLTNATLKAAGVSTAADYLKPRPAYNFDDKLAELNEQKNAAQKAVDDAKVIFDGEYTTKLNDEIAKYQADVKKATGNTNKYKVAKTYFGGTANKANYDNANKAIANSTCYKYTTGNIGNINNSYKDVIAKVKDYPAYPANGSFKPVSAYKAEIEKVEAEKAAYEQYNISEDYAKSYMDMCNDNFYKSIILGEGNNNISQSHYFKDILIGLAILNSDELNTPKDVNAAALAYMPNKSATCTISDEDFAAFTKLLNDDKTRGYLTKTFWSEGIDNINGETVTLPDSLKNTAVAEYFGMIDLNRYDQNNDRRLGLYQAFKDKDMDKVNEYFGEAFEYAYSKVTKSVLDSLEITEELIYMQNPEKLINCDLGIDTFLNSVAMLNMSQAGNDMDTVVLTEEQKDILCGTGNYAGYYNFTDAGKDKLGTIILNNILNTTVADLIGKDLFGGTTIEGIVNKLIISNVNLVDVVTDIWSELVESPVKTIVNLVPVLVVAFDELLVPLLFNGEGDGQYQFISTMLDSLSIKEIQALYIENGSNIGIDQIGWDLNILLPNLMHWLNGDKDFDGIEYYNNGNDKIAQVRVFNEEDDAWVAKEFAPADITVKDAKTYAFTESSGKSLTVDNELLVFDGKTYTDGKALAKANPDAVFTAKFKYEGNVPHLTGIYIADKALRDAQVSGLKGLFAKLLDYEDLKDKDGNTVYDENGDAIKVLKKDDNGKNIQSPSAGAIALTEVVTELSTLFMNAVDEYETSEYRNETKYGRTLILKDDSEDSDSDSNDGNSDTDSDSDNRLKVVGSGLNNIAVALPRLFDIMENLAADKYGVDKNAWVYCYEGKLVDGKYENEKNNSDLDKIKVVATSPDAVKVLDCFAEILVENWLDAILTLVSNVISTDNKISENLPIISGLLNSLGGFGEKSIITDLVNSIFQITRDSDYSFTFTTNHTNPNNKLNGWNKDHAYFLICNISRLVEVIKNLIADFKGDNNKNSAQASTAALPKTSAEAKTPTYKPGKTVDAKATSHNYTTGELRNTKDLIKNLDTMLSSLLSDSTINDFSLGSTETILAGVTSLLNKYFSNDVTIKDNETVTGILRLVDTYLFYITGESKNLVAKDNKVNKKAVYSNNALTGLVVETYALIENIADGLLAKQFTNGYEENTIQYNLLTEAIDGIIAPDAISIRLDGYPDAQKKFAETKYTSWSEISQASSRNGYKTLNVDWGFKDGDKEGFYDGLSASLRLITSILGVLLVDTGWYNTVITPVLGALCSKNDIKLTAYSELVNSKNATGYYDETLKAVVAPLAQWIDKLLSAPASTLIKTVQGLAGVLDDKNTKAGTIKSILTGAIKPIAGELNGVANILSIKSDKLLATSTTLADVVNGLAKKLTDTVNPANIKLGAEGYKYSLSGENLIKIVNSYLAKTKITLKQISWSKIYSSTPEAALVYVVEYLLETVLENKNLDAIAGLINDDSGMVSLIIELIKSGKLDAKELLGVINTILEATDSPTLAYWSFAQYLQEVAENFKYPAGITKAMANKGVENLDGLVESLFPLLASLGVDLGGDNLQAIVNNKLFTNSLLTTIAKALYGALDGLDPTIKGVLSGLGIVSSTKDIAKILTDKSYGATYSSAAKTIAAKKNWNDVKNINWGFTDGSAKAQQGFVNALAAILRPLDDVLAVFLNEGTLKINEVLDKLINGVTVDTTATTIAINDGLDIKLTYALKKGVLTLTVVNSKSAKSEKSTIKLDLRSLKNIKDLKIEGTNGYNSAIIPLLEALNCNGIKTYAQYQKDVKNAKDSILLDILNPIVGATNGSFLNKLLAAPVKELTAVLPNIAMYFDGQGIEQLVFNLLAPVVNVLNVAGSAIHIDGVSVNSGEIEGLLSDVIGIDVDDVSKVTIANFIIPIVNMVLSNSDNEAVSNLKLKNINWNTLISLGTKATYTSKATGENDKFLTGKTLKDVDSGKVLITVLRYVAKTIIDNATPLKKLICGIDAVAKNDLIKTIVSSVFNTISTATPDQVVCAIFYLFSSNPTNAFWDYTSYKTGKYTFSYPSTVDVEFLKSLPPMLDGLISGMLDLNGLIGEKLFTDALVGKLATGLYGAVEGVKVADGSLTSLLAQTGIDFSTANVAKLLTDEKYGKSFDSAASVIKSAGSWKNVKAESLKFGVTDRDSFFHALVAVLRPLYGVLDVLLNDATLSIFNIVHIPGSDGYTSSIVPLLEAFSCYNIKTQYQYREDAAKEYDALLLDIINPLWDKVEDLLNAPLQILTSMLPNLALLIGNDGLCQIIDNLLTPVSALLDAIRPVIDLNTLLPAVLKALKVDLNGLLGKIGIKNFKLDIYDINATLKQVLGGDQIIPLVNNILGLIKIKGTPLGIKLNNVDWLQLASHGKVIVGASQAATFGERIYVEGDSSETLIAVLRYLIDTVNSGNNFNVISSLIAGLLGDNVRDGISSAIDQVLAVLQGDTDDVISKLVDLLQMLS